MIFALHSDVDWLFFNEWTCAHTLGLLLMVPVFLWVMWKAWRER